MQRVLRREKQSHRRLKKRRTNRRESAGDRREYSCHISLLSCPATMLTFNRSSGSIAMVGETLNLSERVNLSISLGESHFREFKSALQGAPGSKYARNTKDICKDVAESLVAFANADGGEILIGVEDDGEITGISHLNYDAVDLILQSPVSHVFTKTPLENVRKSKITIDGKSILHFSVPKSSRHIHQTSDGRCLKRNDLETIPFSAIDIQISRIEETSREYDRLVVDGARISDLDGKLLKVISDQISRGMSIEKCLQYLNLAEYSGIEAVLKIKKAALLLFANDISRWHPRCQVRLMKINGTSLGVGENYNVVNDEVITECICRLVEESWEKLRPFLVQTSFHSDARFRQTFVYPENACREALINAIAHRDYSSEGAGIEIYIFDDRIEFKNPGSLLSTVRIDDLKHQKGVHQSRNSNVSRTLRELGYMRELGEGMRRIYELMKSNELAPPEIDSSNNYFGLKLHHKPMYSRDEMLWLSNYDSFDLTPAEKSIVLLGRSGDLISPQEIIDRVGIVDIEEYRKLLSSLQKFGIIVTEIKKNAAKSISSKKGIPIRSVRRFKVHIPSLQLKSSGVKIEDKTPGNAIEKVENGYSIFIGNIPFNTSKKDLYEAFCKFGEILHVYIPMTPDKKNKGYAFVEFNNDKSAKEAMNSDGLINFGGRALSIKENRRTYSRLIS